MQELSRADKEYVASVIRESALWNFQLINPILMQTCGFRIVHYSGEIRMEITNEHRYFTGYLTRDSRI